MEGPTRARGGSQRRPLSPCGVEISEPWQQGGSNTVDTPVHLPHFLKRFTVTEVGAKVHDDEEDTARWEEVE